MGALLRCCCSNKVKIKYNPSFSILINYYAILNEQVPFLAHVLG